MLNQIGETSASLGSRARSAGRYRTAIAAFNLTILTAGGRGEGERGWASARLGLEVSCVKVGAERCNAGRYASAIPVLERALSLHQANAIEGLENEIEIADILMILGTALRQSGRYARAVHCFGNELDLRREEGDRTREMNAFGNLGHCQLEVAERSDDVEWYEAAAICFAGELKAAIELGHVEAQAEAYSNRVACLVDAGQRDDKTIEFIEEAIAFWRGPETGIDDAPHQLTRELIRLGRCLVDRGETARALAPLHEAVVASRSIRHCGCREGALHWLIRAIKDLDDPVALEPHVREVIAVARADESSNEIPYMADLGFVMADRGDLKAGLRQLEATVQRAEELKATDLEREEDIAEASSYLGKFLNDRLDRHLPAIEALERGLQIYRRCGNESRVAELLIDLAIVHENVGSGDHLREAKRLLEESLAICERLELTNLAAQAHYQLGLVYSLTGGTSEAVAHLETAAGTYRSLGNHRRVSKALSALAAVPGLPPSRVVAALSESTAIARQVSDLGAEAHALRELSRIRRAIGLDREATESQRRGIELVESVRARLVASDDRSRLFEAHASLYADAAHLVNAQHEPRRAFEYAEAGRARLTLDQRVAELAGNDVDPKLSRRRRQVAAEIGDRTRRLEALGSEAFAAGSADPDGEGETGGPGSEVGRLEQEVATLEDEWRGLEQALQAETPRIAARVHAGIDSVWSVSRIQADLLGADAVLLEYLVADDGCLLFCLTRERFEVFKLAISRPTLERRISELCAALVRRDGGYPHGHSLYRALVEPAAPLLEGKSEILICPDGALHKLPFQVLLRGNPGGDDRDPFFADRWSDLPYLLDGSVDIRYIASATTEGMLLEAERAESLAYRLELLALAAPLESVEDAGATSLERLRYAREELEGVLSSFDLAAVRAVPATPGDRPADGAVAAALLDGDASAYRLVHLATHGLLNDRNPWLSALVFDPEEGTTTPSYLHANQILDLRVASQCVTMSGCQTRGDVLSAGEGLIGLAMAFRYAGARSVCASSWAVADRTTTDLMSAFYSHLGANHASPARALAAAQRTMIDAGYHPSYWSAFSIYG